MRISLMAIVLVFAILSTSCGTYIGSSVSTVEPSPSPQKPTIAVAASEVTDATPRPTLAMNESEIAKKLLVLNNGGCNLPCWWGIVPGETSWQDVNDLLAHLGARAEQLPPSDNTQRFEALDLDQESINTRLEPIFSVVGGVVEDIRISVDGGAKPREFQDAWADYSPDEILRRYGEPSRVKVFLSKYGEGTKVAYEYWLFYDNYGFLVTYSGLTELKETVHICPSFGLEESPDLIQLYLQSPAKASPLETLVDSHYLEMLGSNLKNFEDLTGKSVAEYYQAVLQDHATICFDVAANLWP